MMTSSSAIIQHIMQLCDTGRATLAYFYFDFRDEKKKNVRNALTSLLIQLSVHSQPCCDILYHLYLTLEKGLQQPSNDILIDCLKEMVTVATHHPIFIVMDAIDECPDVGILPTPREAVLNLLEDLVCMPLPNLHLCVTSRPEVDIEAVLEPLAFRRISLHDEPGQKDDIIHYINSVVSSDLNMRRWRDKDKKQVVDVLSERAEGM
jgi:hypothetical protein